MTLAFSESDRRRIGSGEPVATIQPPTLPQLIWILTNPPMNVGEGFVRGYWRVEHGALCDVLALLMGQPPSLGSGWHRFLSHLNPRHYIKQHLATRVATRAVKRHYDVDADFYRLMLGPTMAYSCAFFGGRDISLDDAQCAKLDMSIERLGLGRDDALDVLDIGCGWGSMARHIAERTRCRVHGVTISPQQAAFCRAKWPEDSGPFANRLTLAEVDYLALNESSAYDRIISIGMLEHVGKHDLVAFFRKLAALLRPEGRALVHFITRQRPGKTNAWIDANIFPGGYIPLLSEVLSAVERSGLRHRAVHLHPGDDYYRTLQQWIGNLFENIEAVRALLALSPGVGSDAQRAQEAMRLWYFYLSGVSAMFLEELDGCCVTQLVLEPRNSSTPTVRTSI